MAFARRDVVMSNSSNAIFQAWGTALHDMLIAAGLVQTSDTGQVNTATMTAPGVANTFAGYEIFRFNDSLQGTKPIFVKIEYGAGNPLTSPNVRLTVGPSTNGAGTLGSAWGTGIMSSGTSSVTLLTQACYGSGDGSGFVISMFSGYITVAATSFQCFVERSRDSNGDPTGDGLAYGLGGACRILAYTGTWSSTNTAIQQMLGAFHSTETATASTPSRGNSPDGDIVYWLPIVLSCPGVPAWRSKLLAGIHPLDAAMGSTFELPIYGSDEITFLQPGHVIPAGNGMGAYGSSTTNYFLSQYWVA